MSDVFHTGKKLNVARNLRALRLKDIANEFNVQEDTILKWQNRGVPKKFLPTLAHYFGVDEWVITNQGITEEEFKNLILNPDGHSSIRPVFSFHSKAEQKDGLISSTFFDIKTSKILIRAFVWGVKGQTFSQFSLTMQDYYKLDTLEQALYPKPQTLRLITDERTQTKDRVMGEMILDRVKPQTYYFSVHTPKSFELFVFELEQYTV